MKQKTRFSALAAGVVAMGIMLGAGAAQAFTVLCGATECGPGDTNATGILNLDIINANYNVEFLFDSADAIWGPRPAPFDWPTLGTATLAGTAAALALDTLPDIVTVGPGMEGHFRTPFERLGGPLGSTLASDDRIYENGGWTAATESWSESDTLTYAKFTPVPEPGTGLLLVLGLGFAGLGVVRRRY